MYVIIYKVLPLQVPFKLFCYSVLIVDQNHIQGRGTVLAVHTFPRTACSTLFTLVCWGGDSIRLFDGRHRRMEMFDRI